MASNSIISLQPLSSGKQFRSFTLDLQNAGISLLPSEHELIVNVESGSFFLVNWKERYPVLNGTFSQPELCLVVVLLRSWPSFVPNVKLLQAISNRSRDEIVDLLDLAPDEALEPLQRLVEGCRKHFHAFDIEIENVAGHGYKLSRSTTNGGQA